MGSSKRVESTSKLRAVLFDAGNTIIYMPRSPEEMLQEVCRQWGVPISLGAAREACQQAERYYARHYLGYRGDQGEFWRRFHAEALRHLGIDDPDGNRSNHLSHVFGRDGVWVAYPEAAGVCRQLRSAGLKLGVVSNGSTNTGDLLSQSGLLSFFDVVVASQEVGVQKPDPRIFAVALERLGVLPREALFVGDLYDVDILGALAAGLSAVLIDREQRRARADCPVIRNLEELIPLID